MIVEILSFSRRALYGEMTSSHEMSAERFNQCFFICARAIVGIACDSVLLDRALLLTLPSSGRLSRSIKPAPAASPDSARGGDAQPGPPRKVRSQYRRRRIDFPLQFAPNLAAGKPIAAPSPFQPVAPSAAAAATSPNIAPHRPASVGRSNSPRSNACSRRLHLPLALSQSHRGSRGPRWL